jgi:ribosomal protein L11 methyltransferase
VLASWLEDECRERPGGSLLDVGSGTGVLSLAGLLSGASRSLGLDICARATAAAQVNAAHNGLGERAEFRCGSLVDVSARFDCVVANVEPRVLHALAREVVAALAPGGRLGLSGFLAEEVPALCERYGAFGLQLSLAGSEDGWCVLAGRAGSNGLVEGTVEGTVDGTADGTVDGAIASLPEER